VSDHWSYSQVTTYLRCPLQHFFRYVLGLPERSTSSALTLGSAIHQALAAYHHTVQQGQPCGLDNVRTVFCQAWQARKDQVLIVFSHGTEQATLDQGIALLEAYLRQPPPEQILAVEQELVAPLVNSRGEVLGKPLVAVLDLVTRGNDGIEIVDIKTSARAYSTYDAQLSLQPTAYLYAAQHHYGESASFQYRVLVKTQKVQVQHVATARMPTDFDRFGDLVEAIDRAVALGIHYPVESPLHCSSCAYRKPCREWQSDQTLPAEPDRIPLPLQEGSCAH